MDKCDAMYAQDFNRTTNPTAKTMRVNHNVKNSQLLIESGSHLYSYRGQKKWMDKCDAMYAQDFNRTTNLTAKTMRVMWCNHNTKNSQLMIESGSHLYSYRGLEHPHLVI
jgi:hypothetical protein